MKFIVYINEKNEYKSLFTFEADGVIAEMNNTRDGKPAVKADFVGNVGNVLLNMQKALPKKIRCSIDDGSRIVYGNWLCSSAIDANPIVVLDISSRDETEEKRKHQKIVHKKC